MNYLPPVFAFLSVLVGIRGETWIEGRSGLRALTRTGWFALLLGAFALAAQVWITREDGRNTRLRAWMAREELENLAYYLLEAGGEGVEPFRTGGNLDTDAEARLVAVLEEAHHKVGGIVDRYYPHLSRDILWASHDFLEGRDIARDVQGFLERGKRGRGPLETLVPLRLAYALATFGTMLAVYCPDGELAGANEVLCALAAESRELAEELANEVYRRVDAAQPLDDGYDTEAFNDFSSIIER